MNINFEIRKNCPSCKSDDILKVYEKPYSDKEIRSYLGRVYKKLVDDKEYKLIENGWYKIFKCNTCSLVFQKDIPGDKLMDKLYNQWNDPEYALNVLEKEHTIDYYIRNCREILMIIDALGGNPSNLKVFDFGMGWSNWLKLANGLGCNVYGTEISPDRIAHAEKFGITCIGWDDIPNHQFDFIGTEQVFEHISEPYETLQHLVKGLKSDGIIKISVPNFVLTGNIEEHLTWSHEFEDPHNPIIPIMPLEHINSYNFEALKHLGKLHGLELLDFGFHYKIDKIPDQYSSTETIQYLKESTTKNVKNIVKKIYKKKKEQNGTYLFFTKS